MRTVCVVVGSRANYGSIKSAMNAIASRNDLELQLVVGASALLDRYGNVAEVIRADGFDIEATLHMLVEGETPETMAKSTGLGLIELSTLFGRLMPDFALTIGDRFETMATTLAAAYMNIPLAHTMGGEVSGSIDESIRHAITKFSHIHFPATVAARERIIRLGEDPNHVFCVGCPRIDLAKQVLNEPVEVRENIHTDGIGPQIDTTRPFLLVSQHPVTSEYVEAESQMEETLWAVLASDLPAIVLWPNADAGSAGVAQGIRRWRERGEAGAMHFSKNLPTLDYLRLLSRTVCLVGNSSSGLREGAFLGVPAVNVGSRQTRRERDSNVVDAPHDRSAIADAIRYQITHGRYEQSALFGDGTAGFRIAEILATLGPVSPQKSIAY